MTEKNLVEAHLRREQKRQRQLAEQCAAPTEEMLQAASAREAERSERSLERLSTPASSSPSVVLALIERMALDPGTDAGKLERLIAMYERLKAKEAELAYNAAKGRIQKKLAGIKIVKIRPVSCESEKERRRNGSHEAFKYAPLEEIDKHLRPLLAEEEMDLSYSEDPQEGARVRIRGRLKHLPSGH